MGVGFVWRLRSLPKVKGIIQRDFLRLLTLVGLTHNDEISVTLCGDRLIRSLNRKFRGIDEVTDVLSFPIDDCSIILQPSERLGFKVVRKKGEIVLGDIVVNYRQVERQARRNKNGVREELFAVLTHGLLHLLGFDHDTANGKRLMEEVERRVFQHFCLEVRNFGH